uniref:Uncharacterized protein n=1 Tax=Anguilla anguilla TaxID=7936 RepID=A0A0E9PNW0_ANGAN
MPCIQTLKWHLTPVLFYVTSIYDSFH